MTSRFAFLTSKIEPELKVVHNFKALVQKLFTELFKVVKLAI